MRRRFHKILCAIGLCSVRMFGDIRICPWCRDRIRLLDTTYVDLDICDTRVLRDFRCEPACQIPPEGWFCSRIGGHDGPCAAHPVE